MQKLQLLKEEFNAITLIKIFEIPVIRDSNNEYLAFHISIDDNDLRAEHESTTQAEEESEKISFVSCELDADLTLNENLEALHELALNKIIESEFFTLQ